MIELSGKYGTAKIYADIVDPKAVAQIIRLMNQPFAEDAGVTLMPDVHPGIGCVIGTTMRIRDKVCPNLVGVDIGCGMEVVELAEREIDLHGLDRVIREQIPSGRDKRREYDFRADAVPMHGVRCPDICRDMAGHYIGTLGGGNHFIEIDRGSDGRLYLVIHSGSRKLGRKVAEYYQRQACDQMAGKDRASMAEKIRTWKAAGLERELTGLIATEKKRAVQGIDREMAYVSGTLLSDYLNDMAHIQDFADANRRALASDILEHAGLHMVSRFSTVHNYIDMRTRIMRKGAVNAEKGRALLIPLNMRDGSLLCMGKGNSEWNFSAPHGAGRLLPRHEAKTTLTMDEYKAAMTGIYSTSITPGTIDESPMAYKPADTITSTIGPTAEILDRLVPVYNFKADGSAENREDRTMKNERTAEHDGKT